MVKLDTFDERLAEGRKVEIAVEEYMRSFGFDVENNTVDPNDQKSIVDNRIYGDTFLHYGGRENHPLMFDEKLGTFISRNSWLDFKGHFYILTPNGDISESGIRNAMVIRKCTVKAYGDKIRGKHLITAPSGDLGYRFHDVRNYMTLEDFMVLLTKMKLADIEDKNRTIRFWSIIRNKFRKINPIDDKGGEF